MTLRAIIGRCLTGCILVSLLLLALASPASADISEEIGSVPIRDDFGLYEVPLANSGFSKASWATAIGAVWNSPKHGYGSDAEGHLSSAYWNKESYYDFSGSVAVAATVGTGSTPAGQYVGLWLNMPTPGGARSGYEARFTGVNGLSTNYKVELSRWASGTRTVLASKEGFSLPVGTTVALTDSATGELKLWTGSASTYSVALSAIDTTYTSGYAGIEVLGTSGTYYDFRAGHMTPSTVGKSVKGVSCISSSACTAVGTVEEGGKSHAQIRTWDGSKWSDASLPSPPSGSTGTSLNGLNCVSSSSCMAVGSYLSETGVEKTLAMSWNGSSWSTLTPPNVTGATLSRLLDVSCASTTSCDAVGWYLTSTGTKQMLAMSWNGSSWSLAATSAPKGAETTELDGVDCLSSSWCDASGTYVGSAGVSWTLVQHWNGTSWSLVTSPSPGGARVSTLTGIDCTSTLWCRAAGRYIDSTGVTKTLILGWDGTSWTIATSPNVSGAAASSLASLSCTSTSFCVAGGESELEGRRRPLAIEWNGSSWAQQKIEAEAGPPALSYRLQDVSCSSTKFCETVGTISHGTEARNLAYSYDGGGWSLTDSSNFQRIWKLGAAVPRWGVGERDAVSCFRNSQGPYCVQVGTLTAGSGVDLPRLEYIENASSWTPVSVSLPEGASTARLTGVTCLSREACRAVGSYTDESGLRKTYALSWNGTTWSIVSSPNPSGATSSELTSVDCASSSSCRAVGSYVDSSGVQKTLVLEWNGTSWSVASSPNPSGAKSAELSSVDCPSTSGCNAAGSYVDSTGVRKTLILSLSGTTWSIVSSANPSGASSSQLTSIECTWVCKAVGSYVNSSGSTQPLALTWSGSEWQVDSSLKAAGEASQLTSISCSEEKNCIATGSYVSKGLRHPLAMRWTGSEWTTTFTFEGAPYGRLGGVGCAKREFSFEANYCMAVGSDSESAGAPHAISYHSVDGKEWSKLEPLQAENTAAGVDCSEANNCLAVGKVETSGVYFGVGWSLKKGEWSPVPVPGGQQSALGNVTCRAATECVAGGRSGSEALVLRWDGTRWKRESLPHPVGATWELNSASCGSATSCAAVGRSWSGPQAFALTWDGVSWAVQSVPVPAGTTWGELTDVACTSQTSCTAVGVYSLSGTNRPLVERWNGEAWSQEPIPRPEAAQHARLESISCTATETCMAVGNWSNAAGEGFTYAVRQVGGHWSIESSPNIGSSFNGLTSVDCYGSERCVAAGYSTSPERAFSMSWSGSSWILEGTPDTEASIWGDRLESVSCTATGQCLDLGSGWGETGHFPYGVVSESEPAEGLVGNPPETTITSPKPTYTVHQKHWVTVKSSESGSTFECAYDSEAFTTCASAFWSKQSLSVGWHTLLVRAIDPYGNADPSPARWVFNTDEYPAAPATEQMTSPAGGEKTASYLTLTSAWQGAPGEGPGITEVTYQIKESFGSNPPFWTNIPTQYVRNASGEEVKWPQQVSHSADKTAPLFFDVAAYYGNHGPSFEDPVIRAVFDGGKEVAGASQPAFADYDAILGSPKDAVQEIGPGSVDLLTGRYTISETDFSIPVPGTETSLSFGRTYNSTHAYGEGTNVLGGSWQPSIPLSTEWAGADWQQVRLGHEDGEPEHEECLTPQEVQEIEEETGKVLTHDEKCWTEEAVPPTDWAEVLNSGGEALEFELEGGEYVTPLAAPELKLRKAGTTFVLDTTSGEKFVFEEKESSGVYHLVSVSNLSTAKSQARMVYTPRPNSSEYRLSMIIAPAAEGITCEEAAPNYAPQVAGCRSLKFHYTEEPNPINDRLTGITYYNASGNEGSGLEVANYTYGGSSNLLLYAWDPRISPALKEHYQYGDSEDPYNLTSLTPPGEEAWNFSYFHYSGPSWDRLKSVSRASLVEAEPTATTSIRYDVPVSGSGAPYDMSAKTVAEWGQTDYPVDATAIFPPTEVPANEPTSYQKATVHYMDPDGFEVNAASPALPGASGPSITTSETDRHGGVVRELGAQARLNALAAENPLTKSQELDTTRKYSSDGNELLEQWGPLHEVRLESGTTVNARAHTILKYNEGITTEAEQYDPHLVTMKTTGARIAGQTSDVETRVSKTEYDWKWLKPSVETVDPSGLNLKTTLVYDSKTGILKERRLPGSPSGGTARATKTIYYTATKNEEDSECGSKPAWANLPCKTLPVAQPTPTESNPGLPVSMAAAYSNLDEPTEVKESTEGVLQRTTTSTYDAAGRLITTKVSGGGTSLPATETVYSSTTGHPFQTRFVCEAPENCLTFDTQATTVTYNAIGEATAYEDADGNKATTSYDLMGRPVTTSDGKGTQTFTYDSNSGVPTQLVDSAAGTFTAGYNADGNIVAAGLPNGLTAETTYNAIGAPIHKRYQKTSGCSSNCTWLDFGIEESPFGQWVKETNNSESREYTYDKAGRLTLTKEKPEGVNCTTRSYSYDADSNRTSLVTRTPGTGGACDTTSAGTTQSYAYDTGDRLIGAGITYDKLGRITSLPAAYAGGSTLTTSFYVNNLVRSQTQNGLTNTYELDSTGRQRAVVQSGTKSGTSIFHYSGPGDMVSWIGEGSAWSRNIGGLEGGLAAIQESTGTTTLQLTDLHGNVVATASLDSNATGPLSTMRFDEFGNPKQSSGPRYGWLGGRGRRTEFSSGIIQMGVRTYVPTMGRFISPDPVPGGSANAYDYAMQDPVNMYDLNGEKTTCARHAGRIKVGIKGIPGRAWVEIEAQFCYNGRTTSYDPIEPDGFVVRTHVPTGWSVAGFQISLKSRDVHWTPYAGRSKGSIHFRQDFDLEFCAVGPVHAACFTNSELKIEFHGRPDGRWNVTMRKR